MKDMTLNNQLKFAVNITQTNDGLFFDNVKENVTIYKFYDTQINSRGKYFVLKYVDINVTLINYSYDKVLFVLSKAISLAIIFYHLFAPLVNSCNEYYYLLEVQQNFNLSTLSLPTNLSLLRYLINVLSFGYLYLEIGDYFQSIKIKLSYEEVSKIYDEQINHDNGEESTGISKLLRKIDYLGDNFSLFTYQNSKTNSLGGKLCSVVLIFIIAGLGSILVIDFFRKQFPIVTCYTDDLSYYKISDFDETQINKKDVLIAGQLDYENESSKNNELFYSRDVLEEFDNLKCIDDDISSFNLQKNSSLNYYCFNSYEFEKLVTRNKYPLATIAVKEPYYEVHFKMSSYNISNPDSQHTIKNDKDISQRIIRSEYITQK